MIQLLVNHSPLLIIPPITIGTFLSSLELANGFVFPGGVAVLATMLVSLPVAIALTYAQERLGVSANA